MKKVVKAVGLALLLSVAMSAGQQVNATIEGGPSGPVEPFGPGLEVVSYAKNTGQLKMKFTITYFPDAQLQPTCEQLMMTMYPFDGLTYNGPDTLLVPYKTENPYSTLWELTLPPNDTSYLIFREECDRVAYHYGIMFVTTGDTLVTRWESGGRDGELSFEWTFRHWADPREDYERAKREWEARQESLKLFKGKSTTGHGLRLTPEDSATFNTLSEKGKRQFVRMRHLERTPLTDEDRQWIEVDGRWYVREHGDYKFRHVPGKTMEEIHAETQRYQDSLAANPPNNLYDIILDLRDPKDYDIAYSLTDSLVATKEIGFYRTVVTRPVLMKLIQKGIDYQLTGRKQLPLPDTSETYNKKRKSEQETDGSSSTKEGQEILFFEGFEGAWPGQWSVGDDDPGNGLDYWGDLYGISASGNWSGWCADEGDMPDGERYDDYMWAYMKMTVPVNLSEYVNRRVSYKVFYDTESGYDYYERYASSDGYTWVFQERHSGNSGGWIYIDQPITTTGDYYIMFLFVSDYIFSNYQGVFIDDIKVTGESATQANLTWDWPSGWDWPVVASADSGTNTVSTLYGGEPTYIDWSIINDGDVAAFQFHVGLYLDDALLNEWYFDELNSWDWHDEEDYQTTISTGYHSLKLWVDNRNEVQESNENDNTYEIGFTWLTPEITYTGHVYYWDMNPLPSTELARYVMIKLWDKDGAAYEQLGADFTDQNGYFEIGPVPNDNDTQDKDPGIQQDISFSIHAKNFPCEVRHTEGELYQHSTATVYNHPSGVFNTTIQIPQDSSGAFFVADAVLQGWNSCNDHSMYLGFTPVYLDAYTQTEYLFDPPPARIRISTLTTDYHPETWDRDMILHEYGHRVADYFDFFFSDTAGWPTACCGKSSVGQIAKPV
jgi:hypothetical protein